MADEEYNRKLTTIFSADAAGYSRLMGKDEAATVKTIPFVFSPAKGSGLCVLADR